MLIKGVFFDIGATLLRPYPTVAETFCELAALRGENIALEAVRDRMAAVDELYEREYRKDGDFWCSRAGCRSIWLRQYRFLAHSVGFSGDIDEIACAMDEEYHKAHRWGSFDDVVSCLEELNAAHIKVVAVSNWDADLANLLEDLGLGDYFDDVVASAAVGVRKPNPAIFELALKRNELQCEEVIHVGDHIEADGDGALAAGIRPVIIDRKGAIGKCSYHTIASLRELTALLSCFV